MSQSSDEDAPLEETIDSLYAQGVTDGLPVVPPTEARVEEMLRGTDRPRDHEIGRLGNREGQLTVEKLAVNAVMAGCAPIHMPVLLAGAEAMADPQSNAIQIAVSTGSWSYLWIVNGPIRRDIDIRSEAGAFGPGFKSNRTIGRALGLAYRNTTLIHPGEKNMGVQGNPFKYGLVAGENEEQSPWEPLHVTAGFDREESTITLSPRRNFIQYLPHGMSVDGILRSMQYNTIPDIVARVGDSFDERVVHSLGPYNAEEFGRAGMSKRDVKTFLCENSYLEYDTIGPVLEDETRASAPDSSDATPLQARQIDDPESVQIVVVGGGGRFNAVGHTMGGPVTQGIELPEEWDSLLDQYAVQREWGQEADPFERNRT